MASVGEVFVDIRADSKDLFSGLSQARKAADRFASETSKSFAKTALAVGGIVGGFEGLKNVIGKGFEVNIKMEGAQTSFTTLLKSGEKAKDMIQQLQQIGVKSPFDFDSLSKSAKLLLSMGVNAKNVVPYIKKIGDAVAAVGGSSEQMENVALAIAQISAKGKVSAEEMNQLAENGIPAWQILSEKMHKSTAELMKMGSDGKLLAKDVLPLLIDGLGDKFGGAMQKAANTFSGQLEQMKEQSELVLGKLFEPMFKGLETNVLPRVNQALQTFSQGLKSGNLSAAIASLFPKSIAPDIHLALNWFDMFRNDLKSMNWNYIGADIGYALKSAIGTVQGIGQALIDKISQEFKSMDINQALTNLGSKVKDFAIGFTGRFSEELQNAVKSGNAAQLGKAIGDLLVSGLSSLGKQAEKIGTAIIGFFGKLDWVSIGEGAAKNAVGFALGFVDGILSGNWIPVLTQNAGKVITILAGIWLAPERWSIAIAGALSKIPFVGRFLAWFTQSVNTLGKPVRALIDKVFDGVWTRFVTSFSVRASKTNLGDILLKPFSTLKQKLLSKLDDLATGANAKLTSWGRSAGKAAGNAWNSVKSAIASKVDQIYSKLSSWWKQLVGLKNKIVGVFRGIHISIPKFKLPHVSVSLGTKKVGPISIPYPKFSVSWYAKGGIFDKASVIGVGEAGPEAVVPLSGQRMKPFAQAIAKEMGVGGGAPIIHNHFYVDDQNIARSVINAQRRGLWLHG
ncbi:tape measure protein [Thermoactinomyces daqus]|uniref:Tape measure protein n=1 Tax=Thermoactinomyces daqus TaxID=1329516 RepID=A0A7W1X8E9_9BACL|nr:tape measure protein [Thermoactinomyces daqus]MBA4541982.1 tape measure protein [Thermoactinomyces daqus]